MYLQVTTLSLRTNLFISQQDYDAACLQPCDAMIARGFMDGIFHAEEIINWSLTGQGNNTSFRS